jgi:hypothetical protein
VPDDPVPVDDDADPLEVSEVDVDWVFVVARVEEEVMVMVEVLSEEVMDSLLEDEKLLDEVIHVEVGGGGITE